jgi:hypothetical protein
MSLGWLSTCVELVFLFAFYITYRELINFLASIRLFLTYKYSKVVVSLTEPAVLSNVASVDKSLIKSVNSSTLHTSNPNLQQAVTASNTAAVAGVKAASSTGFINSVAGGGGGTVAKKLIGKLKASIADPGCLSRIRRFPSWIQGQKDSGCRI